MSDVITSITAEAEVKQYTLVGDDIYVKRYTNENIPLWYRNLVSDIISSDTTVADQAAAIAYLESLAPGYNISITSLQNKDLQIDTSIESLVTKDGDKTAAIAQLNITKVDATSAAAIAQTTIGTYFAGSESAAWFNSKISTYASNIASNASSITTLSASLDGQEVRIDTVDAINIQQNTAIGTLDTTLSTLSTSVGIALADLQGQIDGAISTWFADGVPTSTNYPYTEWTTPEERANHVGDLYYDRLSGYAYRFVNEDLPSDTPDAGFIYWMRITDVDVVAALANAATAQDTADGKRTVFYSATTPVAQTINGTLIPIEIGDLWVHSTSKVTKVAVAVSPSVVWGDITNTATENALLALTDLEEARDGNVVVYYETSTTIPAGMTYGDYLVDTDSLSGNSYTVYRYENATGGSSGTLAWYVNTGETAKALSSGYRAQVLAGTAQSTADGKVKTWYQISAPVLTAGDVGDIWVDTDNANKLQVWSGTAWTDQTSAQGTSAYTWSATASKLITSPDGSITGWQFGDGTNTKSYFQINATNFKISDGTTGYTPFSIVDSNISFNGVVDFTNTNTYGTTTIDGGKITANTVNANRIDASTIAASNMLVDQTVRSSDFTAIGGAGFRLKSNAAGTYEDPTIYGAYIRGGVLDGATITGQLLDISSMKVSNGGTNTGAFSIAKVGASAGIRLYGKNYSSGYIYERCLLSAQKISINAFVGAYTANGDNGSYSSYTLSIEYSIDSGAWISLGSTGTSASTTGLGVNIAFSSMLAIPAILSIDSTTFSTLDIKATCTVTSDSYNGAGNYTINVTTTNI